MATFAVLLPDETETSIEAQGSIVEFGHLIFYRNLTGPKQTFKVFAAGEWLSAECVEGDASIIVASPRPNVSTNGDPRPR